MKSLIISIAIIALLAGGVSWFSGGSNDATGVGMIESGISFKEEAGLKIGARNEDSLPFVR